MVWIGEKTMNVELWWINLKERHLDNMRRWISEWILNKVEWRGLDSSKNKVKWRAVVNKLMNRRVPYNKGVLVAQERFCCMALVGCTGLNVKLGSMTAVLTQRSEAASLL